MHTGTSSLFLSSLKCQIVQCPITKQHSETDGVMKLRSAITIELSHQQEQKLDASYKISDISLEYEIVNYPNLAKDISDEHQNAALLYDTN